MVGAGISIDLSTALGILGNCQLDPFHYSKEGMENMAPFSVYEWLLIYSQLLTL